MTWEEEYNLRKKSPVYLEEEQHVYIHLKSLQRYLSVTTILSLIKNDFPVTIKAGIIKQYENFKRWINKCNYNIHDDTELYISALKLFANYKNLRPYELATWNGEEYKKYKPLNQYTLSEFYQEFSKLEKENPLKRLKAVYINNNNEIMSQKEIGKLWEDITKIANVYGTMVHEIVEQYILLKQKFIKDNVIEERIRKGYTDVQTLLDKYNKKYKYSTHVFEEYRIDEEYEEFKHHIINSFNKLQANLGRVCVPERIMFLEERCLSGMADVLVIHDDERYSIGDHKTNKNFTFKSEYGKKLKPPFNHLDECDYNLYNLQLSVYALMYGSETGMQLEDMWISYYSRDTKSFELIKLKYLEKEAKLLLEVFSEHLSKMRKAYEKNGILDHVDARYKDHLMFLIDKKVKTGKALGWYKNKSKEQVRKEMLDFIDEYLKKQEEINLSI